MSTISSRVRRQLTSVAALSAMLAVAPVLAQAAPSLPAAAPATDPARLAAARTLIATMRVEQQMSAQQALASADGESALNKMIPAQIAMRAQLTDPQGWSKARQEAVRLIVEDRQRTMEETVPLLVEAEVRRYATHYSLDDLRGLDAFYHTPLGQRVIADQPKLAVDTLQFQQNVLAPVLAAHSAVLVPKLQAAMGPVLRQAVATASSPAAAPLQGTKK